MNKSERSIKRENIRVLVCGGREYSNKERLYQVLGAIHLKHTIVHVIHGAARGADLLAEQWAKEFEIPYTGVPAQWKYGARGKAEGYIRNAKMLAEFKPDLVVAFPGNKGTKNMKELTKTAKVSLYEVIDD